MGWFESRKYKKFKEIIAIRNEESIDYYSFLISLIINMSILMIMALIVIQSPQKISPIHLSFSDIVDESMEEPMELVSLPDSVPELPNPEPLDISSTFDISESIVVESEPYAFYLENNKNIFLENHIDNLLDVVETKEETSIKENTQPLAEILSSLSSGDVAIGERSSKGDIDNRLMQAGAQTGTIQVSIAWDTIDDVDLHIAWAPPYSMGSMEWINFMNKRGNSTGGFLDIDMNAHPPMITHKPVENIFYPPGNSLAGTYMIGVHLYQSRTGLNKVPVIVRIKVDSKIETIRVFATPILNQIKTIQYGWSPGFRK